MSKCPFWSTNKERVNCYDDCPINTMINENEVCPFKEYISSNEKLSFVDKMNDDLFYSQDSYSKYDEDFKVMNY